MGTNMAESSSSSLRFRDFLGRAFSGSVAGVVDVFTAESLADFLSPTRMAGSAVICCVKLPLLSSLLTT